MMKAKKTNLIAAATLALLALALAAPPASARYKANLQGHACWLAEVTGELHDSYTCDLVRTGRWLPCGLDRDLYEAICAAEDCAERVHRAIELRRPSRIVHRHICETRGTLDKAKSLACRCRISCCTRTLITQADHILCLMEGRITNH